MPNEIFAELEQKLDSLIEEVETLRLEISELREVRDGLRQEQSETEARLKQMLGKFSRLKESAADSSAEYREFSPQHDGSAPVRRHCRCWRSDCARHSLEH